MGAVKALSQALVAVVVGILLGPVVGIFMLGIILAGIIEGLKVFVVYYIRNMEGIMKIIESIYVKTLDWLGL